MRIAHADGELLEDVAVGEAGGGEGGERELALLVKRNEGVSEPEGAQRHPGGAGSRRIIDDDDAVLDILLVVELRLDARVLDEGAEVGGLVPPDRVVVHVHLAQAAHHLHLIARSVVVVVAAVAALGATLLCVLLPGEWEAVGHLQRPTNVQPEQLARDETWQRALAVLYYLEDHQ